MFGPFKKSARIGQWDGRRRSSRSDEPLGSGLLSRSVLLRLGAVLVTALGATFLGFCWGTPPSYRVGEAAQHDLRARVYFEVERLPAQAHGDDPDAPADAPLLERFPPGTLLVPRGVPITEPQYTLLQEESRAYLDSRGAADHFRRGASLFLVLSLLSMLVVLYVARFQHGLAQSLPKVAGVCA